VALSAEECERLQNLDADYKQQLNDLSAENADLTQLKDQLIVERDQLSHELEERETARLDAQEATSQLEQAQAQAAARLEECQKLDQQLEQSYQQVAQLKMKIDLLAHRHQEQAELSVQAETQLNALNLEYQHSQEMTGQLLKEK
jgi:chromosome segregation ATPase